MPAALSIKMAFKKKVQRRERPRSNQLNHFPTEQSPGSVLCCNAAGATHRDCILGRGQRVQHTENVTSAGPS